MKFILILTYLLFLCVKLNIGLKIKCLILDVIHWAYTNMTLYYEDGNNLEVFFIHSMMKFENYTTLYNVSTCFSNLEAFLLLFVF